MTEIHGILLPVIAAGYAATMCGTENNQPNEVGGKSQHLYEALLKRNRIIFWACCNSCSRPFRMSQKSDLLHMVHIQHENGSAAYCNFYRIGSHTGVVLNIINGH